MNTDRQPAQNALAALAPLLEYPGLQFSDLLEQARKWIGLAGEATEAHFLRFSEEISKLEPTEREELYTSTFDVNPACVLYVSIHLFGEENFKRGELMASLAARYSQAQFSCHGELPDHLSVLLRFAAEADPTEGRDLAEYCLLGPLERMLNSLSSENPYRSLLATVRTALQSLYPDLRPAPNPQEQARRDGMPCPTDLASCGCGSSLKANMVSQPPTQHLEPVQRTV